MRWDAPETLLVFFVAGGALCLFGGAHLAKEPVEVREERSRGVHRTFVKQLDLEIDRLRALYQSHLQRLAAVKDPADTKRIESIGKTLAGVRQISLLSASVTSRANVHLSLLDRLDHTGLPVPVFSKDAVPLGRTGTLLDAPTLLHGGERQGWIEEPGEPFFYWYRRDDRRVVVILIEITAVQAAINDWLKDWLPQAFEPVEALEGPDSLESPSGKTLISVGMGAVSPSVRPQFLLPLATPFGTWQLGSWDRYRIETHIKMPIILTGAGLAILFLVFGLLAFNHQRRAVLLAQKRVSFANQVSHELRSPLTNILLNADLAADALEGEGVASKRLRLIQEEAQRLGRLISNVLTFSRREDGYQRLEPAPVVVDDLVEDVLDQFRVPLERLGVAIQFQKGVPEPLLLDRDALVQILANLVSNVEKYGASGGLLEVESASGRGHVRIGIQDRGPGIRARDAQRVFEPFVRLHERVSEGVSGTGLGLAIARGLAQDMGGDLVLRSSEKGAHFEVVLPVRRPEGNADAAEKEGVASLERGVPVEPTA